MSNYTKTTDFEAKDSLPSGDSGKIIKGAEFETEFDAISTAIATKADADGATLTGTTSFETLSDGTISVTAFVDEDDMVSDSATLVPTQQSVKAYVDSQVTAQDLDFQADSGGALSIDLDSEALTLTGGTGIDTSGALNEVTFAIDSTVATLTGTQTLTNKTLTAPTISGNLTTDGNIDGRDVAADGTKLDGIESGATADQTAAEIRTLVDSATDSNVFTDADHTKLDGIEANATADQTAAEIRTLVEAATDSNVFTDADHTKLDGIEASADVTDTANVTAAGALMDSEVTNLAQVKAFDSADYATAAQGSTADSALQNVVEDTTPQLGGDLASNGNDILFADNDKAIFGAGSDLQIYHDGSNSYIQDAGTGNLFVQASNVLWLRSASGTAYFSGTSGNEVSLYHNGSEKLSTTSTGIDVTGTVTADGLTVDGNNDIQINRDGVSSAKLFWNRGVTQDAAIELDASESLTISVDDAGLTGKSLVLKNNSKVGFALADGGDISFYEDTGTTAKLFWDASAERLGIGTSSPAAPLHLKGAGGCELHMESGDGASVSVLKHNQSTDALEFYPDGSLAMTLQAGNQAIFESNVGIGTDSPAAKLYVEGDQYVVTASGVASNGIHVASATAAADGTYGGAISFDTGSAGASGIAAVNDGPSDTDSNGLAFFTHGSGAGSADAVERVRIDYAGNVGIGTSSPDGILKATSGSSPNAAQLLIGYNSTSENYFDANTQIFRNGSFAEKMRIDSSGNLLVGTSDSSPNLAFNSRIVVQTAFGVAGIQVDAFQTAITTCMAFTNSNGQVGGITTNGSATAYNTSSDQRLKDNIVDAPSASDDIDAIQVRSFDWKADGSHQKYGMVAQELQSVAPEAVSGDANSDDMMGVDYSKLVPMLVKEIQSLRARVAQLEGAN